MAELGSNTRYCSRCLSTFEDDHDRCPNLACRRPRPGAGWGRMYGPGDVFDRHYRIHNLLALGGAGVTYLAREIGVDGEELGPRLALKVLFASRDEGPYLRRLATEAQILQELDHPNIVQCLGFVHRAGHSPYLVTRFEPGGSLLDHIKRVGSLPVKRACQVCRQICWALDKAHTMGIVHRDLKPENVLLARVVGADEDPVVRVADFGIAKVQGSLGGMTRVGAFVGTPQYAAPEQFVGTAPTPAADVYAVGALLYFQTMVMPVARFTDRLDPSDSYELLLDSLPPVVERGNDDPDAVRRLNRVLEICMDPDPRKRCTIEELDELLGAVGAGRDPRLTLVPGSGRLDTQEELLQPLEGGEPTPVLTASQGDEAAGSSAERGEAAGTSAERGEAEGSSAERGEAEGSSAERGKVEPQAGANGAPPTDMPRTPTVSPTDLTPQRTVDAPQPARRRGCCGPMIMGSGLATIVAAFVSLAGLLWWAPGWLPAGLRPSPVVLDPGEPADSQAIDLLRSALVARLDAVRERCGADTGSFTVELVVQADGRISRLAFKQLDGGLDGQCIGQQLSDQPLPSPGWRPVKLALALSL